MTLNETALTVLNGSADNLDRRAEELQRRIIEREQEIGRMLDELAQMRASAFALRCPEGAEVTGPPAFRSAHAVVETLLDAWERDTGWDAFASEVEPVIRERLEVRRAVLADRDER